MESAHKIQVVLEHLGNLLEKTEYAIKAIRFLGPNKTVHKGKPSQRIRTFSGKTVRIKVNIVLGPI